MKFLTNLPSTRSRNGLAGRVSPALLCTLLLGLLLVLRLGLPLWQWLDSQTAAGPGSASPATALAQAPDLSALQALDLFAAGGSPAPTTALPPMNTALNMRLEGVVLASESAGSLAVISSSNTRGSYRAGDTLPAGTGIRVDSIARDHVVIDNRGQREVLWLFGSEAAAPAATLAGRAGASRGPTALALPPSGDARVLKTAARLAEIISVTPETANGRLIGYRLAPGMRLKDFVQLGFKTSDIVTAVNGIALDDVANLPKLYSLMDGATEVSFSLLRDGAPLNLKVTLSPDSALTQAVNGVNR